MVFKPSDFGRYERRFQGHGLPCRFRRIVLVILGKEDAEPRPFPELLGISFACLGEFGDGCGGILVIQSRQTDPIVSLRRRCALGIVVQKLGEGRDHLTALLLLSQQECLLLERKFSLGSFWIIVLKLGEIGRGRLEVLLLEIEQASFGKGGGSSFILRIGLDKSGQCGDSFRHLLGLW